MTLNDMYELQKDAKKEGVIFCYSGYFSQKILLAVGEAIKHKMNADEIGMTTAKKIFTVFVEQVQNIIRYSSESINDINNVTDAEHELRFGVVVVGKDKRDKFYISCGNKIMLKDKNRLVQNLEEIQNMDKEQLKKAYKEKLKSDSDEYSKGAGIGFLEIARKANEPIVFEFKDTNESSFFFLQAYI